MDTETSVSSNNGVCATKAPKLCNGCRQKSFWPENIQAPPPRGRRLLVLFGCHSPAGPRPPLFFCVHPTRTSKATAVPHLYVVHPCLLVVLFYVSDKLSASSSQRPAHVLVPAKIFSAGRFFPPPPSYCWQGSAIKKPATTALPVTTAEPELKFRSPSFEFHLRVLGMTSPRPQLPPRHGKRLMGCSAGALLPGQHVPELLSSAALCYLSLSSLLPCTGERKMLPRPGPHWSRAPLALEPAATARAVPAHDSTPTAAVTETTGRYSPKPRPPRALRTAPTQSAGAAAARSTISPRCAERRHLCPPPAGA
jgi:hypothetical protein